MIDIPKALLPLANAAQALADLMAIAQKANSLEQVEVEHKARLTAITKDADAVKSALVAAQAGIKAAEASAAKVIADAKDAGDKAAAAVLAAANDERARALEAVAAAKKAEAVSEAEERRAKKRLGEIEQKLAILEPQVAAAESTIAKAEAIKRAMG